MSGRHFLSFSGTLFSFALFLFLPSSNAAETGGAEAPECAAQAGTLVTQKLAIWQQRLKLDNWNISVSMSHMSDLKPKTLGNIHWDADKKTAVIHVLNPADYQLSCKDALDDIEFTIVHELIHLELSSLPRSEASRRDEEHAVNQLTDALLKLDRHE